MTSSLREELLSLYAERTKRSREFFERAIKAMPGGVNYHIRFVEPNPIYVRRAEGCYLWDIDGNKYVDFWVGHYALIMGHSYKPVVEVAARQLQEGSHFGYEHEWEVMLAEQIKSMVKSVELVRFTNSGTEANMYAARVARTYTKRRKLAKFEGCWHGGYDGLHKAVSYPYERPSTAGLPREVEGLIVTLPFNELSAAEKVLKSAEIAAVFLELVPSQGGFTPADVEFVKGVEELCKETGTLLVIDEVITGFRVSTGGAQAIYGIDPDLTTFGKIVGGGSFPAGALGGKVEVMEVLDQRVHRSPDERAFHGGTYSGNPLVTRAGYTLLKELEDGRVIEELNEKGKRLREGLSDVFERVGIKACTTGISSLVGLHFSEREPRSPREAEELGDRRLSELLYYYLLTHGFIYMNVRIPKLGLCYAHGEEEIRSFIEEVERFAKLVKERLV